MALEPPRAATATATATATAGGRDRATSGMLRKELDMRLTAYLPAVVRRHLERQDTRRALPVPATHRTRVVSMFADVSGFTAMTESLAARGPVGAEELGRHLNSYFEQLLRLVASAGGDVFKFAGDAMLIFWPENKDDTPQSLVRRALQCALRIQTHLHEAELAPGVVLSVKVGVGLGDASIAHLGGESDGATARIEYVAVGPALEEAFAAEHLAQAGDVICSPACWASVCAFFDGERVRDDHDDDHDDDHALGFHKVTKTRTPVKMCSRRPSFTRDDAQLHARMKQYVSRAVWPYLDAHDEFWGSELRDVTVLFVNLGFCEQDLATMRGDRALQRLQDAFAAVQRSVYAYEGTINKFLVDDKGSTAIAAFGLPPVTHENDPIRGILASLAICAALGELELKASVGITTGLALCGVVGHQGNRREYTVLGDVVNLSARLMQRAKSEGGGVITDEPTKSFTQDMLHFEERPEILVKGKNERIKIHRPYPRMSILMDFHISSTLQVSPLAPRRTKTNAVRPVETVTTTGGGAAASAAATATGAVRATPMPNVMANMHRVQVRDAQRRISLRAEEQRVAPEALVATQSFVHIRAALLDKCSKLNRFAPGGAFVLEGDIGVGKTTVLRSALASLDAGDYHVLVGTASPFATNKPYAIWSELLTKSAMAPAGGPPCARPPASTSSPASVNNGQINSTGSRAAEAERRERVATFVRAKIRQGAAPNTTLVRYVSLLNAVLDTDFGAFPGRQSVGDDAQAGERLGGRSASVRLLEHDVCAGDRKVETAPSSSPTNAPSDRETESAVEPLKGKEEEIAAWFLSLLEMDLAQQEEAGAFVADAPCLSLGRAEKPEAHDVSSVQSNGEDDRESEWRPAGLDLSGILLLCALHAMSRERATVFCLDSAMHMDEKSWVLVAIVAKYFTNCLVVVGTRPPSLALGEITESSSFRKQLQLLKRMPTSRCETMEPFCGAEIDALARQLLHVVEIPAALVNILNSRSQGNPLFLHEILAEMKQQQVITVDADTRLCQLHVQEPWGDKSGAQFCFTCHLKLVGSKAKRRCKSCGYVFCARCTPKACHKKLPGASTDPVRHCRGCYNASATRRPSGSVYGVNSATDGGRDKRARPRSRIRAIFHSSGSAEHSNSPACASSSVFSTSGTSPPAQTLTHRIALRPPRTVKSVLTTMLDQLTMSQRMLMKTASVIGPVFEQEMLRGTCPIEAHLSHFAQDLDELERLAMIRRIDTFVGGVPTSCKSPTASTSTVGPSPSSSSSTASPRAGGQLASPSSQLKVKFEFNHGFMRGVIRDQMLSSQLDKLHQRVSDFRAQQDKELRQRFFEKANESLSRPVQLTIQVVPIGDATARGTGVGNIFHGVRRALTPTRAYLESPSDSRSGRQHRRRGLVRRNSHSGVEGSVTALSSDHGSTSSPSSPSSSSTTQVLQDESEDDCVTSPVTSPNSVVMARYVPTFMQLKTGRVFVKKQSSVFSRLKVKSLTNARLWKTRFAVLQNVRLVLQYDEGETDGGVLGAGAGPVLPRQKGTRQGTSLFLKGAKVSACDPEVAAKVNCFQVEVSEWTKGKYLMSQRRTFVIGVESEAEVDNWIYMVRYAIESLENQPTEQHAR